MKFIQICILALVCSAVLSVESSSSRSGHAKDDWNEKTDVQHVHREHEGKHEFSKSESWKNATGKYVAQAGDVVNEWTVTDGKAAKVSVKVEAPVTRIVNGKVVTTYETQEHFVDKHRRFKTVKRFWSEVEYVQTVAIIIAQFSKLVAPLSDAEYALVNTMATTDSNRLWSDYDYWLVKDMDLQEAVAAISHVYKSPVSADDIQEAAQAIKDCQFGYVAGIVDSSSIDVNNMNGWTIYAEFFAATCSKESPNNQLFVWAGSKQGEYLPGAYSAANAVTLTNLIKRWLFSHVGMLVSCKDSPVQQMSTWKHKTA